ncbi:MAG: hypothetical protein LW650_00400 [Planctomycetaceae bacterium]|jgi:subtilisin-like proprotein convertase family protein|nr:hypothetical protein [Planctomycetaceae bacterium]
MRGLIGGVLAGLVCLVAAGTAAGQRYVNINPIGIPVTSATGVSSPYPSEIVVSGAPRRIKTFSVAIQNINHLFAEDIRALLVAPGGQRVLLVSGAGSNTNLVAQTWIFNQEATATLPTAFGVPSVSGIYRPTVTNGAALPAPAPGLPYSTDMSTLYGTDPNGTWRLYVADGFPSAAGGTILGGWTITFTGDVETDFGYQGVLSTASGPVTGDANVRFTLFGMPFNSIGETALAGPITRSLTGIERGLVQTELDFGAAILESRALWLGIEVESPPGSGFVPLSPRQAISIAPQAGRAIRATDADQATRAATADQADTVAWSGVTGVPVAVATPPAVTARNTTSMPVQLISAVTPTTVNGTPSSVTMVAGQAVVNWSLSGYTNAANTAIQARVRLGTQVGPWTTFFFNQGGVHMTISGTAALPTVAGPTTLSIEVQRTFGTDGFRTDNQDSFTATVINLRQ